MFSRSLVILLLVSGFAVAQETPQSAPTPEAPSKEVTESDKAALPAAPTESTADQLKKSTEDLSKKTGQEIDRIAKTVDSDPQAKKAAAGILQPIYVVAEKLAFPSFHWLAFGLMVAGVVSYALQLVLGKLVVLTRMGFSLKEIISDAVGLAISVIGLVLTTQAAAENSTFTQSAAAVISATVLGAIVGLILYLWGQSQELQAARGRSVTPRP